jgi:DNA-binding MarR family transcriptional regulator
MDVALFDVPLETIISKNRFMASKPAHSGTEKLPSAGGIDYGILPELVGYHLRRAQVAAFGDFAAATRSLNLTPGLAGILIVVSRNAGLSQTALARAMGIENSTLVEVIDKLEQRDLVERRPAPRDRRTHALYLSREGQHLVKRLEPLIREHEARLLRDFTDAERQRFIDFLRRLGDAP